MNASQSPQNDEPNESDLDEWYDNQCQQVASRTVPVNVEHFVTCRYKGEMSPGQVTVV